VEAAGGKALEESLVPAAEKALRGLADRAGLADAECVRWPWGEPGIPVMTLAWKSADGVGRNIHVAMYLEAWTPFILVEGNAWTEAAKEDAGSMRNFDIGRIPEVGERNAAEIDSELDRLVGEAYDQLSGVKPSDLDEPLRTYRDRGDPGPLTTESYLGQ
jgi:hypothetical protein